MNIQLNEKFEPCNKKGCKKGFVYMGGMVNPCECMQEYEKRDNIRKMIDYCNLPSKYINCSIENFEVLDNDSVNSDTLNKIKQFVEHFDDHLRAGDSLLLRGLNNCGKTHVAAALQKLTMQKYKKFMSYFILLTSYINLITKSWSTKNEDDLEDIDRIRNTELLVLDDVDKTYLGSIAFKKEILDELLRYRDGNSKSTIITTNLLTDRDLGSFMGIHTLNLLLRSYYFLDFRGTYTEAIQNKLMGRL